MHTLTNDNDITFDSIALSKNSDIIISDSFLFKYSKNENKVIFKFNL